MRTKEPQPEVREGAGRSRPRASRGFTLLLAALIASIVLSLGAAIFTIATKQISLSSIGRESQFAFYAADSAAECALYWDSRFSYFGTTTPTVAPAPSCSWQPLSVSPTYTSTNPAPYTHTQSFQYQPQSGQETLCAEVTVEKCQGSIALDGTCTSSGGSSPTTISTLVHADGYSVPCNATSTSKDALQRTVELRY